MGAWGVRSDENDEADDALDAGFERVHGAKYEAMMDDRDPTPFEEVQQRLASPETLAAALGALAEDLGPPPDDDPEDELGRLAYAGVVVRHAECGVALPEEILERALRYLESETIDWEDDRAARDRRRQAEIRLLRGGPAPKGA
jgi:hypothetical protein